MVDLVLKHRRPEAGEIAFEQLEVVAEELGVGRVEAAFGGKFGGLGLEKVDIIEGAVAAGAGGGIFGRRLRHHSGLSA